MSSGIGSFYSKRGVVVGQAMGLYAPENTLPPGDTSVPFDETIWSVTKFALGSPSAGTWTVTMAGGPLDTPITVAALAFGITQSGLASALQTALQAVLGTSYTVVVTGSAGNYFVSLIGPGAARITITGSGTSLTGGTFSTTPPPWTPCGATEQGWQSNYNIQTNDIHIEEQSTPVARNVASASFEITANLSEDTVDSLQLALSAARTVQAQATGVVGKTSLNLTSDLPVLAVVLVTKNRYKMPRRYYIPGATCAVNVGTRFARAASARLVPVTFSSVCETERIQIDEITAPAL